VKGSSWYSQALQNLGIWALGIVTPQNKANVIMMKGFRSAEIKGDGVTAATV
jgi:hypothetical protein